ncbi:serine carboxypeptidase [Punctularia strigosozonata HHB-11173 SS5]|uniref:serine carboxypeptidase n=1 Tax=Punctularia strigosozonata (strain HHB-11173) TaxID=741275 RepID=UPI0004416367|nr:serine carboxypeptidase [Punctularia strigosozonata HHB-11173 SS5]EIN13162.1 serine carboxypeptidase [Punctularia strigosozonata HHB-11173 SS5]
MLLRALCTLAVATASVAGQQLPLFGSVLSYAYSQSARQASGSVASYDLKVSNFDAGLFTPVESLSALSDATYTTLAHPAFPKHSVRIKKSTDFCDGGVNAYTGYIDIEAKHLFFYFFESRNDPDKDDVILWTNGGPGCSSSIGLFMELGPCRVPSADHKTVYNPYSWNAAANIFFIDQPVGVGFSYAEHGEHVDTTEDAAADIAAFVAIFFENFSKFKGRGFHMAGESYGGRYIPVFASAVYDQNAKLVEAGLTPINLTSIMIGNGVTDFYTLEPSKYDMMCTPASVDPILPVADCVRMKQAIPRCQKWAKESCVDQFDAINCGAAMSFCATEIDAPFFSTGMNPYDISKVCDGPLSETLCYPITKHISSFLDLPSVRDALGVDPAVTGNFTSCSSAVGAQFHGAMDMYRPTYLYVAALLERGVRALIYVGAYDWICNWVGNERWTLELEWTGQEEFAGLELREWEVNGTAAGKTRSARGLTFATVDGAGHMVPYDKPAESLELVKRWLAGQEL